jgi:hypothetical protein
MAYVLLSEGRRFSISHKCEWRNGPNESVYIMKLFLCKLISDDLIAMETVCLWTVDACYCGGCVPMVVTMSHQLSSSVLLSVVVYY